MKRIKQFLFVVLFAPLFVLLFIGGNDNNLDKRAYLWYRGGSNTITVVENKDLSSSNRSFPNFVLNTDYDINADDYESKNPGEQGYGLSI